MEEEPHVTTDNNSSATNLGTDTTQNQNLSSIKQDKSKSSKFVFDCC
jgi:hypothetical protein